VRFCRILVMTFTSGVTVLMTGCGKRPSNRHRTMIGPRAAHSRPFHVGDNVALMGRFLDLAEEHAPHQVQQIPRSQHNAGGAENCQIRPHLEHTQEHPAPSPTKPFNPGKPMLVRQMNTCRST